MHKQTYLFCTLLLGIVLFSGGLVSGSQSAVTLGTAGDFVILSKTGISTTGATSIVGDIGVSPIDHTAITGFSLIGIPSSDLFLTSSLVTGKISASNLVPPTPSTIGTSISNMETAFTQAQGRTSDSSPEDTTELGAGDISGLTLTPGLHIWSTGLLINAGGSGDAKGVTLDCSLNPNGVFIFQIAQNLILGSGAEITLIDCNPANVFWAVNGGVGVEIGTTAHMRGIILASKAIHLRTGATLEGRALSQTAVTLDANAVTAPIKPVSLGCSTDWVCSDWSTCSNGKQTKTCEKRIASCVAGVQPALNKSCTSVSLEGNIPLNTSLRTVESTKNEETNTSPNPGTSESKAEILARINLKTGLNMSVVENESLGTVLRAYLSNGNYASIRVLPAEASLKAQALLNLSCEKTNCTVELKEKGRKKNAQAVYEFKAQKNAKLFGFIRMKMNVRAYVNAETGEVVDVKKPWWAKLAIQDTPR